MRVGRLSAVGALLAAALAMAPAAHAAGTGAISGAVTGDVTPVCVLALDATGDAVASTATDSTGNYTLAGVLAGSWVVEFYPDDGCLDLADGYAFQFYPGTSTPASATPVSVSAGQTVTGVNATLQAAGTISGTVTDASGFPLAAVCVILEDTAGRAVTRQPTDSEGNYTLAQLPAGQYILEFVDDDCAGEPASYASAYYPDAATPATAEAITVAAGRTDGQVDAALVALPQPSGGGGSGGTGFAGGPGAASSQQACSVALVASTSGRWTVESRGRLRLRLSSQGKRCPIHVIVRRAERLHGRFAGGAVLGRRRVMVEGGRRESVTIPLAVGRTRARATHLWITVRLATGATLVRTVIPIRWARGG